MKKLAAAVLLGAMLLCALGAALPVPADGALSMLHIGLYYVLSAAAVFLSAGFMLTAILWGKRRLFKAGPAVQALMFILFFFTANTSYPVYRILYAASALSCACLCFAPFAGAKRFLPAAVPVFYYLYDAVRFMSGCGLSGAVICALINISGILVTIAAASYGTLPAGGNSQKKR